MVPKGKVGQTRGCEVRPSKEELLREVWHGPGRVPVSSRNPIPPTRIPNTKRGGGCHTKPLFKVTDGTSDRSTYNDHKRSGRYI